MPPGVLLFAATNHFSPSCSSKQISEFGDRLGAFSSAAQRRMSHGIHTTARVWLKTSNLKWIAGTVDNVGDKFLSITTEDGQHIEVPRGSDKLSQRTPAGMEMVDNLTTLPDLDEPNMLHSLNARYKQNLIYTRTGPILVALNPWQDLSLYGNDVMQSYRRRNFEQVPPHVFAVPPHVFAIAEAAFSNLQSKMKDQTILVSGDSGSGKTESTKFMMQYLATVANHTVATANTEQQYLAAVANHTLATDNTEQQYLAAVANHTLATTTTEQQVLQCNPVLEAFGNAKTLRNDNSSRFGKYIDIHFDEHYALCGAKIDTYLLEKSRVVGQEPGERNFHIFYQLCSQTLEDPDLSKELDLRPAEQFRYIAAGAQSVKPAEQFRYIAAGAQVAVAYKPATSFSYTRKALEAIGIAGQETLEILKAIGIAGQETLEIRKVLAAVMHLGEVTFSSDKDQNAVMANPLECDTVARLLGCEAEELRSSFVKRKIQAGPQDLGDAYTDLGDASTVSQTEQQAVDTRDALARAVYGSLFDALVRRINLSLSIQTKVIKTR
ncbi:P-loop containing nucleoside triphosphate hydrolase protein [Baffinella frigidus]|nr:P-loop containing nucleoside triphosphate hydrolase protein [Cryptophyta sp. CCMP2293]